MAQPPYGGPSTVYRDGWPEPELTAKPGTTGAAIIAFVKRFSGHPAFPQSPWSDRHGEIFLPDLDQPQAEFDDRPRYRLMRDTVVNGSVYAEGNEIDFILWPPVRDLPSWEPVNESARRVHKYRARFHNVIGLPGSPYDESTRRLTLRRDLLGNAPGENVPAAMRTVA